MPRGRPKTKDLKAADLIGLYGIAVMRFTTECGGNTVLTERSRELEKRIDQCTERLMSALLGRPATEDEVDLASLTRDFSDDDKADDQDEVRS